jgi:hypothetical protein
MRPIVWIINSNSEVLCVKALHAHTAQIALVLPDNLQYQSVNLSLCLGQAWAAQD